MMRRAALAGSILAATTLLACVGQTPDEGAPADGEAASAAMAPGDCDPVQLAQQALSSGQVILQGVSLEQSTPIAEILAHPDDYAGKNVRIEGIIVEICATRGCYVTLQDPQGNKLNLKVVDGELDFRDLVQTGQYAVGEGVFSQQGEHGAQLDIMKAGARVGSTVCPF